MSVAFLSLLRSACTCCFESSSLRCTLFSSFDFLLLWSPLLLTSRYCEPLTSSFSLIFTVLLFFCVSSATPNGPSAPMSGTLCHGSTPRLHATVLHCNGCLSICLAVSRAISLPPCLRRFLQPPLPCSSSHLDLLSKCSFPHMSLHHHTTISSTFILHPRCIVTALPIVTIRPNDVHLATQWLC